MAHSILALVFACTVQGPSVNDKLREADASYLQYKWSDNPISIKATAAVLDEVLQTNPDNYEVLWRHSRAYYHLGDDSEENSEKVRLLDQAVQSAKRAVAVNPEGVDGHYWLGAGYGRYGEAKGMLQALWLVRTVRKEMETVVRHSPTYEKAGGYLALGRLDYELPRVLGGSNERSIRELELGLQIAPSNLLMKTYLAESYIRAGRRAEAKSLLEDVLSVEPNDTDTHDAKHYAQKVVNKNFQQ